LPEVFKGKFEGGVVYVGEVEFKQRKGPAIIIGVSGAEPVLGVQALETLGFKVNPKNPLQESFSSKFT